MTYPVSMLPFQAGWTLPAANVPGLSDDEQRLMGALSTKLALQAPDAVLRWLYYDGEQRMQNLGISIPQQFMGVRTVLDWPRIAVDTIVERCQWAGFRLPGATEVDSELAELAEVNDLAAELPLAFLDAKVAGRGFGIVGSGDEAGDPPLFTVESPLNMTVTWDPRTRRIVNGYQASEIEGVFTSVLYLPNQTVYMSREDGGQSWSVYHRDIHKFGEPPIVRLPNRARSSDREGRSDITPAIMSTTDATVRALLGMDIAREVYSIPHLAIMGATESDWKNADGSPKSALGMAMTKILAFERDALGNVPELQQLKPFDPAVFTKIIDNGAQRMSSFTGFAASLFGLTATANPSSADAIRVSDAPIERKAGSADREWTPGVRRIAQLMWRYAHNGAPLPDEFRRLQVDWADPRIPTPAATTDAVVKQIAAGAIPATSDVTLGELGYTPLQRALLAQDRANDPAWQLLQELGTNVAAKDVISALRLLKATGQPTPQPDTTPAPDVPAQPGTQSGR